MKPLSRHMRDLLIEHIDGQPVPYTTAYSGRTHTLIAARARGFISVGEGKGMAIRPKTTSITQAGRQALAAALADWAEALIRAGFDGDGPTVVHHETRASEAELGLS